MSGTISVKAYTRSKPEKAPDPFQSVIDARLAKRRAEAEAFRRANEYRNEIGYKPAPNALAIIISKLRRLAVDWKAVK